MAANLTPDTSMHFILRRPIFSWDTIKVWPTLRMTYLSRITLKWVLKISLLYVIPKEHLADSSPAKPSIGMTVTIQLIHSLKATEYNCIFGVIPNEGSAGLAPAESSFGMTATKILRPVLV